MALPNPIQTYFVPVREDDLVIDGQADGSFETVNSAADNSAIRSLISISIAADGTVVYYDHWEDGYELDITNPQQSTTEIWGDGDPSNGEAPGTNGTDIFQGGESFVLSSTVPVDRDSDEILFDGSDLVSASFPIAVTRAAFPTDPGSVLAGATEALDTGSQGDHFVIPVGVDTNSSTDAFEMTDVHIMASSANTPIYVNGVEVAIIADAGDTFVAKGVGQGDVITTYDPEDADSGKGVQVTLVTGDENSVYEMRWYSLLPREDWSNDYYTPVFTEDADNRGNNGPTQVWIYNPNDTELTVTAEIANGLSVDIDVPPGGTRLTPIIPENTGLRVFTEDGRDFFALTQTDTTGNGATNDWGHPLIPANQLTSQAIIGLGFGNTDQIDGNNSGDNRSLVWVTATEDDTTVFVDYDGDSTIDDTFELDRLESVKVVDDSDNNMSGAIIFAEDGDGAPTDIAVAYGQDPETQADESDSLDFGTVVPPLPELTASKNVSLADDADGDGEFSPGDTVTFEITILNFGRVDIPAGGYNIEDFTLPVFDFSAIGDGNGPLTYVLGSTSIDFDPEAPGGETAIADSGSGSPFPLDVAGYTSGADLDAGKSHVITFDALIKDFNALPAGTETFTNEGVLKTGEGVIETFDVTRPLAFESGIDIEKLTNGVDADTPDAAVELAEGADVVWTYAVTNTGETHLANVDVTDDQGVDVVFDSGDTDNDGVLDPGETWIFEGTGVATAGDYVNEGSVEADAVFADGTTPVPGNLGGGTVSDSDLSHYVGIEAGTITGRVFEDAEADGIENAEGIGGVTVELLDGNGDVVNTATTDAGGNYTFDDVIPGDYTIRFAQPGGFDGVSPQDAGNDDTVDSDGNVNTLTTAIVTVKPGETVADVDQGFWKSGEIGDLVFEDSDGDGIQDPGEDGVEGVGVTLRDENGDEVATTTTDAAGEYTFDDVAPGEYTVEFDVPDGNLVSPQDAGGDDAADSDIDSDGETDLITVTSGEVNDTVDAGLTTPSVTLEKTADKSSVTNADETVTYTYTVTNTGSAPLTGVTLTDAGFTADPADDLTPAFKSGDIDDDGVLDVGETWVYEASETVSQTQIDAGNDLVNVATVDTNETGPVSDDETVTVDAAPKLAFDKVVTDVGGDGPNGKVTEAGQVISYTLTVTNEGAVTLTGVTITDPLTKVTEDVGDLAPGASASVSAEYIVRQEDIDGNGIDADGNVDGDGDIDNVATADSDQTGPVEDAEEVLVKREPAIAIVKTATPDSVSAGNEAVTFTYTVTNEGNVTLTDITVVDDAWTPGDTTDDFTPDFVGGDDNGNNKLDVDEVWTFEETVPVAQAQVDAGDDLVNVVTVDSDETDPATDEATVTIDRNPALSFDKIVKDVDGRGPDAKVTAANQVITYELVVKNEGNVTLNNVTIEDPLTEAFENVGDLAPGETASIIAQYVVTQDDVDTNGGGDGDIDNVATAGSDQTDPETDAEEVLLERNPAIAIVKTADVASVDEDGDVVTYTYVVTNEGNVTLTDVTLVDDAATPADNGDDFAPDFVGGDDNGNGKLDVGETWTFEAEVEVDQGAIDAGADIVNVATVDSKETGPERDDATVTVDQAPSLAFDKVVKDVDGRGADAKVTAAGQVITYVLVAENTGNVTLTNVTIEDPLTGTTELVAELAPGAKVEFEATYEVSQDDFDTNGGGDGDIDNEATADSDQTDPEKDAEEVLLEANPAIAIVKTADVASVDEDGQVVTYTYTVTNEGNVALSGVEVTDDAFTPGDTSDDFAPAFVGGDDDNDGKLDVGEIWTFKAEETVTQEQIDAGDDLVNVATVVSEETGPEADDATITIVRTPDLAIVKDVTAVNGQGTDLAIRNEGDVVTWTITVENTGNTTLDDVLVEDPTLGLAETIGSLAPGETQSFTVDYIATQEDIDGNGGGDGVIENVATAKDDEAGEKEDDAEVPVVQNPELDIVKTATAVKGQSADLTVRAAGDEITYEIVVTNSGNLTLDDVKVEDDKIGFETVIPELAPGESRTYEVTYFAKQEDIDTNGQGDGDIDNVAVASDDEAGTVEDNEEVPVVRTPELTFDKEVIDVAGQGPDGKVTEAGQVITYALVAENTGNTTLTNVTIEDPLTHASVKLEKLEPGDKATIHTKYTVTQEDIDTDGGGDGDIDNEATASSDETPPEKDAEEVLIDRNPEIAIVKTADTELVTKAGQVITYTYVLTNTGNVTLSNVVVTDDNATPGEAGDDFMLDVSDLVSGDTDDDGELDLDETWVFEKEVTVSAEQVAAEEPLTNLAIVSTEEGATASDTATVEVDAPDLCTDIEDHFDRPESSAGATIRINAHSPHENGSNDDDFIWGDKNGNAISANEGDNLVVGNAGNDVVNGGNTTDEIYGDDGDDVLNGNGGDDLLSGGDGDDKLYGAHGDDKILAGKGDDLVEGGAGDDRINAGEGNDTVQGEGGDDCIAGGKDDGRIEGTLDDGLKVVLGDELFGNGGADRFEYQAGDGVDFLFDFMAQDGDTLKLFGITEDQATSVTANTPYGPAAGLVFDLDGDGTFEGGVFLQQVRTVTQVEDLVENGAIEFL